MTCVVKRWGGGEPRVGKDCQPLGWWEGEVVVGWGCG